MPGVQRSGCRPCPGDRHPPAVGLCIAALRRRKATRDGLEIKLRDRDKALENVARHLGMFNDKVRLQGDAENPLSLLIKQIQGSAMPVVANPPDDEDDD